MDKQDLDDFLTTIVKLKLPRIKTTSKIQRTIMSATMLSNDTTSIISTYYFPLDIEAVSLVAFNPILIRTIAMLACDMGIWPIVRIIIKKYRKYLIGFYRDISIIQLMYNLACKNGYTNICGLLHKIGASPSLGIAWAIKGGCIDLFNKEIKHYEKKSYFHESNYTTYLDYLCESNPKTKNHIIMLWVLIRKKVNIKPIHIEKVKLLSNNDLEFSSRFLEILESYIQI
jgi:hypothetical protein